jgi:CMP-N,N'-diacetyllegionaminic acid synthase
MNTRDPALHEAPRARDAVAIILARAGSKGVPGKNVTTVGGCIEWTILAARESNRVATTVVSTDCPRAKEICRRYGVKVLDRPADLAGDQATVDSAARDAVIQLERQSGRPLAATAPIVLLYANVPVRPVDLIDVAVQTLVDSSADSVQSFTPVGKHHPWWTCVVDESGELRPFDGVQGDPLFRGVYRRQELPPAHIPDGGVMVVTRRALMLEVSGAAQGPHAFLGAPQNRRGVITPEGSVIDIDSSLDVLVADAALKNRASAWRWERRATLPVRRAG